MAFMLPTPPSASIPRRILVVDDERVVADSIRRVLQFEGYLVETAPGGEAALALFQQCFFDLVITDYEMPLMKGDRLAIALKALRPGQPVLLISAYGEQLRSAANPLTAVDAIIGKPFQLDELRETIATLLSRTTCLPPTESAHSSAGKPALHKLP